MKCLKCGECLPANSDCSKNVGTESQRVQRLKNLRKKLTLMGIALCFFAFTGTAQPITVYNNFGPGNNGFEYETGMSWLIAGFFTGFYYVEQAQSFTPAESGYLSDIYAGLMVAFIFDQGTVKLAADSGGLPSEDVLESWVLNDLPSNGGGEPRPATNLVSVEHPYLTAGQTYWVWISAEDGSSAAWGENVTGSIGHMAQRGYVNYVGYVWDDMGSQTLGALQVDITYEPTGIDDQTLVPTQIALDQNFPNPFKQSTSITFEIPQKGFVNLAVFDNSGRLVRTLIEDYCTEGAHQVRWNGENSEGLKVPGGVYICCLKTKDGMTRSHQMVLIE